MNTFICKRCGYKTSSKSNICKHLRRKNPCEVNNEDISVDVLLNELLPPKIYKNNCYQCKFCERKFNSQSNYSRHINKCTLKNNKEINELKKEIENLKTMMEHTKGSINNVNTNNNVTNIQINSFGRENLDHIPKDFLTSCFMMKNIPSLIENIYFDEECPENHNVKLRSSKNKTANVYDDGKWRISPVDKIIDEMVNKGQTILSKHYKYNKEFVEEEMSEDEIMEVIDWLQKIWNDSVKVRKPLKEDIMAILMSYKDE